MQLPIPIEGSCRAEYADGYIHDETALHDVGRFKNVFNDILEGYPEEDHGKMIAFTVFYGDDAYRFDWTILPDNARPIRFKKMEMDEKGGEIVAIRLMGVDIGYQFTDEKGENIQDVMELR